MESPNLQVLMDRFLRNHCLLLQLNDYGNFLYDGDILLLKLEMQEAKYSVGPKFFGTTAKSTSSIR